MTYHIAVDISEVVLADIVAGNLLLVDNSDFLLDDLSQLNFLAKLDFSQLDLLELSDGD
jgi:hypothetical protein